MNRSVFAIIKHNSVLAQTYYASNARVHKEQNPGSDIYRIIDGQENLTAEQIRRVGTLLDKVPMIETTVDMSTVKFKDRQHIACIWSQWFPEGSVSAPKGKKVILITHPENQDPLKPESGIQFFTSIISQRKVV